MPQVNPIQMINTFYNQNSLNQLMFILVRVNGIGMKALIDTGATHSCLASNVAARSGLVIEAHDNVVTSLNGRDHWVDRIIIFVSLTIGEYMGFCDLILMHLRNFEMILGIGFFMQPEVSILPYLRTLVFMERGASCTVMTVR